MKNVLRRSLSVFLAATIIFSSAIVGLNEVDFSGVLAVGTKAANDIYLEYELNDDGESYTVTFCDWSSQGDVVIPEMFNDKPVTKIGDNAFYHCYYITSVTIPDTVTTIGVDAFRSCNALESVTMGKGVEKICNGAFKFDDYLVNVYITDLSAWCEIDFEDRYSNPIYNANNLYVNGELATDVVIPDGVKQIPLYGFSYDALNSIVIPESVEIIKEGAFFGCENLASVTLPDNITVIEDRTFIHCKNLISVSLPENLTSIGEVAFAYCESLNSIEIPENVTNIGVSAFLGCKAISSVIIPDDVKNIGEEAFSRCENLASVTLGNSVESIGEKAFYYCTKLASIEIPENVTNIGNLAFYGCDSLTEINVDENNADYLSVDGILFDKAKATLIQYPASKEGAEYIIPHSVTNIGEYAFSHCLNLVTVDIPDSVSSIGEGAFSGCIALTSITIPDSITILNDYIFNECKSLTSIVIPDCITSIEWQAFCDCENLSSVTIGKGVTSIAYEAFWGCTSLKSIEIPANVTAIGERAFGLYFKRTGIIEIVENFVIYGRINTAAHSYAKDYGLTFIDRNHTHKLSSWKVDKKATVYSAGKKYKECTECGEVLKTAKITQLKCSKPKLKSIENTEHGVLIKWGTVKGADSYAVYRKTGSSGKYTKIGTTKKTYYTDKTAKSGKKYYYYVKAVNEAGSSSASSSLSKYHLADTTLSTPKSTKSGITLKWKKVTGADGYMVYRKTGSGSYSKIATVKGSTKVTYTDKSAKKGKTYTYKIKAYKSKTYSAYSNTKKIKDKY